MNAQKVFNKFRKEELKETKKFDWNGFGDYTRRQFEKLAVIGTDILNKDDEEQVGQLTMSTSLSWCFLCPFLF